MVSDGNIRRVVLTHTSFRVALEREHNLWRTVPSCSYVFRHVPRILLGVDRETSCETEIANLQLAISIDEQISRLQITVKDIGRVNIFQSTQNLVDKGLEVGVGEGLPGTDNSREITFH